MIKLALLFLMTGVALIVAVTLIVGLAWMVVAIPVLVSTAAGYGVMALRRRVRRQRAVEVGAGGQRHPARKGEHMRATRLVAVGLLAAAAGGCASGSKAVSSTDAARVRVVNDASQVQGCQVLGTVADNDFEDLQRKAAKVGGNVALMTPERKAKGGYFGVQDYMTADVYRCSAAAR